MSRLLTVVSCIAFCCLMSWGCGGSGLDLAPVSGRVTLDGEPLANVTVTFLPKDGASASGRTNDNGEYELTTIAEKGALLGEHTVTVTTPRPEAGQEAAETSSDDPAYEEMMSGGGYAAASQAQSEFKEPIPARYNTNSELTKEVTSGANTIDLKLTTE